PSASVVVRATASLLVLGHRHTFAPFITLPSEPRTRPATMLASLGSSAPADRRARTLPGDGDGAGRCSEVRPAPAVTARATNSRASSSWVGPFFMAGGTPWTRA